MLREVQNGIPNIPEQTEGSVYSTLTIIQGAPFWDGEDMPGWGMIPRKPRLGKGRELRTLCDGASGIMIRFDPMEGTKPRFNAVETRKRWYQELGATVAVVLRWCEPWFGSGRVLIADSWFGSLKACKELRDRSIFSVMNVKTRNREYPTEYLHAMNDEKAQGEFTCMDTTVDLVDGTSTTIAAVAHKGPAGVPLCTVSSCSTTQHDPTKYSYRKSHLDSTKTFTTHYMKHILIPMITRLYRMWYGKIDQFNRAKDDGVFAQLTDVWRTLSWAERDVTGIIAILFVNTFRMAMHCGDLKPGTTIRRFYECFIDELLDNPYMHADDEMTPKPAVKTRRRSVDPATMATKVRVTCEQKPIGTKTLTNKKGKQYKKVTQARCAECGKLTTKQCVTCAKREGVCIGVCGGECWKGHVNKVMQNGKLESSCVKRRRTVGAGNVFQDVTNT